MKRAWINYTIDILISAAFLGLAVTGILKYPGVIRFFSDRQVILPADEITRIHRWTGLILTGGVFLHLILHLRWIGRMTRRIVKRVYARLRGVFSDRRRAMVPGRRRAEKDKAAAAGPVRRTAAGRHRRIPAKLRDAALPAVIVAVLVLGFLLVAWAPNRGVGGAGAAAGPGTAEDGTAVIDIRGEGSLRFDPDEVESVRPEIFVPGAFSVFDILVHLDSRGKIDLDYHWDPDLSTHVVDTLNGEGGWWYRVVYDGGWSEDNVFRMDLYPYKERARITLFRPRGGWLEEIYTTFREETLRIPAEGEPLVIPEVILRGARETQTFENVTVTAHNLRDDLFQEGVITAIDVIMSMGDQGLIDYDIQWFESIGTAEIVRNYFVQRIDEDAAAGRCGFVFDSGSHHFFGFRGNHIHLPSDARVITAPEYVRYFWICI
jgi:hypothetical protein